MQVPSFDTPMSEISRARKPIDGFTSRSSMEFKLFGGQTGICKQTPWVSCEDLGSDHRDRPLCQKSFNSSAGKSSINPIRWKVSSSPAPPTTKLKRQRTTFVHLRRPRQNTPAATPFFKLRSPSARSTTRRRLSFLLDIPV